MKAATHITDLATVQKCIVKILYIIDYLKTPHIEYSSSYK